MEKDIENINKLLKLLRSRLSSWGKNKSTDGYGNIIYADVDIFSNEALVDFLYLSLSQFNMLPKFTFFTFDDDRFVKTFAAALVDGASIYALASKALIEKGREFAFKDDGIVFHPPSVSEMLNTQYQIQLHDHHEKLKTIKQNIDSF